MLFELNDITVSRGGHTVLSHIDMQIREGDKLALVGANGAGKTTLLSLLMGELDPDADDRRIGTGIRVSRSITRGILRQVERLSADCTVEEYILKEIAEENRFSKERFDYEMEFNKLFTGFGFSMEDRRRSLCTFSGGEQTKICFIHLLLMQPDLLLLDEPTNHLDIESVEWLEQYMRTYPKAVVFVSHDRFFLDRVADVVYELENHRLTRYSGNYSRYREQKQKNYAIQEKRYNSQQAEIKRLDEVIERFKKRPNKAAFARAKKSQLARMELVEKPVSDNGHMFVEDIEPLYPSSKIVYEAEKLQIGYGKDSVLAEVSLRLKRGQKIAVIGANGSGKSTFLKTVAGELPPVKGKSELGNNVLYGYFDQRSAERMTEETVAEYLGKRFPSWTKKELHTILAAYLFESSDVHKRVNALSGGERARLYLAELILNRPNLLILDEPTNHMDVRAKETMESAFCAYKGSLLFVSHDRYFISRVADSILLFDEDGVYYYPFGYEHYLNHMQETDDAHNLPALVSARDQAMIDGLKAVPKPERYRLREISTEKAYADWKLRIAAEPLEQAWNRLEEALTGGEEAAIEDAWQMLHESCLAWYDIYLETEEGV